MPDERVGGVGLEGHPSTPQLHVVELHGGQGRRAADFRRLVPEAAVYAEMGHATWTGPKLGPGGDSANFRRTTPEQFQTTAHLACTRGGDGVSLFNFAYYREHGGPGRGPFSEPPLSRSMLG